MQRFKLIMSLCTGVLLAWFCLLFVGAESFWFKSTSISADKYPNIKVQFVTPDIGWIVGPRLLQTVDGGKTWKVVRDNGAGTRTGGYIFDEQQRVQFFDAKVGWMLGSNNIHKTTDGGRTWSEVFSINVSSNEYPIQSFFFISQEVGWALGEYLYRTADGGRSWERLSRVPKREAHHKTRLWFTDSTRGFLSSNDELYSTKDGGKTWQNVCRTDSIINAIFFIDQRTGWCVGMDGLAINSTDGGQTWLQFKTLTNSHFHSVFFIDSKTGWLAGGSGTILYTKDGGLSWNKSSIFGASSPPIASISFSDKLNGWAVGGNGTEGSTFFASAPSNVILRTSDGGVTWHYAEL